MVRRSFAAAVEVAVVDVEVEPALPVLLLLLAVTSTDFPRPLVGTPAPAFPVKSDDVPEEAG